MYDVVLTADRGSFTDYNGSSVLGYVACMPYRLVPRLFMDKFFTPPMKTDKEGKALFAPYALRKIEAVLVNSGFSVAVVPPEKLSKFAKETKVIGFTVHDPFGLDPVSAKLSFLFGGGPTWTAKFFSEFSEKVKSLKNKYGLKVIAGGPGAWELTMKDHDWIDVLFINEAELELPRVVKGLIDGEQMPKIVYGKSPKVDQYLPS